MIIILWQMMAYEMETLAVASETLLLSMPIKAQALGSGAYAQPSLWMHSVNHIFLANDVAY